MNKGNIFKNTDWVMNKPSKLHDTVTMCQFHNLNTFHITCIQQSFVLQGKMKWPSNNNKYEYIHDQDILIM